MRLTHIYINIISEAHSYLRTMSVRLSHTWVITARLTHSYMYAGYRLGGGGGVLTRIYMSNNSVFASMFSKSVLSLDTVATPL